MASPPPRGAGHAATWRRLVRYSEELEGGKGRVACGAIFRLTSSPPYKQGQVFNTDQGVQFTNAAFLDELEGCRMRVSMEGKGRFLDNIFIERLWHSLKYEEVFIKGYSPVAEVRWGIGAWFAFYNNERPHQALDYRTPSQVFEQARAYGHVDNATGVDHMPTVGQQQAVSIQ